MFVRRCMRRSNPAVYPFIIRHPRRHNPNIPTFSLKKQGRMADKDCMAISRFTKSLTFFHWEPDLW